MEEYFDNRLNYFHPKLRPYVKALLTHEFGILGNQAEIEGIEHGKILTKDMSESGDRFMVKIPYCQKNLHWQILMNPYDLTQPPDFIMEDKFFDNSADVIETQVPSLANWCPSDAKCLLNVVLELLDLFKNFQINILRANQSFHRCLFEYDTLISMADVPAADVEVCLQNANRGVVVIFLIRINLDFSVLPIAVPNGKNLTVLLVEFKDNMRNVLKLLPREELECVLGGPMDLPELPSDTSLMDYVPMVEEKLQQRITDINNGIKHRKILYSHLVQCFEPALLNADTISFRSVSFLLQLNDFFCILQVNIPLEFPEHRPRITLFSMHKNRVGAPRSDEYNNYKYKQNWCCDEMAREIYKHVRQKAIVEFRDSLR